MYEDMPGISPDRPHFRTADNRRWKTLEARVMDSNRFDTFVRSLGHAVPRRAALVGALGTGLGGLLIQVGVDIAAAKKRKKKKKCKGGKKKCGKKCIAKTACCISADCPAGADCVSGACVCPNGETNCGDVCVDLATDAANCGACGKVCEIDVCVHGACGCTTSLDCPATCGGCGTSVEDGSACVAKPDDEVACDDDDDCPLGAICVDTGGIPFCSGVC
jgi:hypothetical protein